MNQFLISNAYAQNPKEISNQTSAASENAAKSEFSPTSFLPLIAIFVIFYFMIIRPQSKKLKEHQQMLKQLKIGNKIITSSGIVGIVRDIIEKEEQIRLEIADQVVITILRQHVSQVEKQENQLEADKSKRAKH